MADPLTVPKNNSPRCGHGVRNPTQHFRADEEPRSSFGMNLDLDTTIGLKAPYKCRRSLLARTRDHRLAFTRPCSSDDVALEAVLDEEFAHRVGTRLRKRLVVAFRAQTVGEADDGHSFDTLAPTGQICGKSVKLAPAFGKDVGNSRFIEREQGIGVELEVFRCHGGSGTRNLDWLRLKKIDACRILPVHRIRDSILVDHLVLAGDELVAAAGTEVE